MECGSIFPRELRCDLSRGEEKEIELTEFGGAKVIHGFNGLVGGPLEAGGGREQALERAKAGGFGFASRSTNEEAKR